MASLGPEYKAILNWCSGSQQRVLRLKAEYYLLHQLNACGATAIPRRFLELLQLESRLGDG